MGIGRVWGDKSERKRLHPELRGVKSRSCGTKTQFTDRNKARQALARIRKSDESRGVDVSLSIYRCRVCGYLHIGHDYAKG
jgi:rubrerythrin